MEGVRRRRGTEANSGYDRIVVKLRLLKQARLPWSDWSTDRVQRSRREVSVGGRVFPIDVVRHRWARRYLLRMTEEGRLRLTVPRGASISGGLAFLEGETAWISREWVRLSARTAWALGTMVFWRGQRVALGEANGNILCGDEVIPVRADAADLRTAVHRHWRKIASAELPDRCRELASRHGHTPTRISVRDQRSRWGACSSRRSITLNWRLVQMPPHVADYVMLHEIAHMTVPNHSAKFWLQVSSICPDWREAEQWLRQFGRELL